KDKPALAIAHDQVIGVARLFLFEDELLEGSVQKRGKIRGVLGSESDRARIKGAESTVGYDNGEKGIRGEGEMQCLRLRVFRRQDGVIEAVSIEMGRGVPSGDDQ